MKRAILLLLLAGAAFCVWFVLSSHSAILGRMTQDGLLASKAKAKVLSSSSVFREAKSIVESRWEFVPLGKSDVETKFKKFSYQTGLQSTHIKGLLDNLSSFGVGEEWEAAELYFGEGSALLSEFLVVHFANDRVLIWYSVL